MRFKSKEKGKLDSRRKLWSLFGWCWAYKRTDGEHKTEFTSDKHESDGYGYFKSNRSLNCGCRWCKGYTEYKRHQKKVARIKNRNEVRDLMKVINNSSSRSRYFVGDNQGLEEIE